MSAYWEQIPARPTTYRGIEMRSRLEARYAASLDNDGWRWQYEPRAYASGARQYLPDFAVDVPGEDLPHFVEVRPTLESALAATERMQVIRDSLPTAALMVVWPGETRWHKLFCPRGASAWVVL